MRTASLLLLILQVNLGLKQKLGFLLGFFVPLSLYPLGLEKIPEPLVLVILLLLELIEVDFFQCSLER